MGQPATLIPRLLKVITVMMIAYFGEYPGALASGKKDSFLHSISFKY